MDEQATIRLPRWDASSAGLVLMGVLCGAEPAMRKAGPRGLLDPENLTVGKLIGVWFLLLWALSGPQMTLPRTRMLLSPFEQTRGRDSFLLGIPGREGDTLLGMSARSDLRDSAEAQ